MLQLQSSVDSSFFFSCALLGGYEKDVTEYDFNIAFNFCLFLTILLYEPINESWNPNLS